MRAHARLNPALFFENVNEWLRQESKQGVSRIVHTLDGHARAVLSDKYKRHFEYGNHEFLMTVFHVLMEAGMRDGTAPKTSECFALLPLRQTNGVREICFAAIGDNCTNR